MQAALPLKAPRNLRRVFLVGILFDVVVGLTILLVISIFCPGCRTGRSEAGQHTKSTWEYNLLDPTDPKEKLPSGVPRVVDTNGNFLSLNPWFTTGQYRQAAVTLMVNEANQVALEMHLTEQLPITESNLTETWVAPFGYHFIYRCLGNITTSNYFYIFAGADKFNGLGVANYDKTCISLEREELPIKQLNLKGAYQLATQWLAAASMDVDGLNRDCKAHVAVSPYWNDLSTLGQKPKKRFVPIYYVWWTPRDKADEFGGASVELFLPTKKLIQLSVAHSEYVLRKPLAFTNFDLLFPGTAPVTIFTNFPVDTNIYSPATHE
jgi:hypothetical protein